MHAVLHNIFRASDTYYYAQRSITIFGSDFQSKNDALHKSEFTCNLGGQINWAKSVLSKACCHPYYLLQKLQVDVEQIYSKNA